MKNVYTVEPLGKNAGLKEWHTVLRNGNPLRHFNLKSDAEAYKQACQEEERAAEDK